MKISVIRTILISMTAIVLMVSSAGTTYANSTEASDQSNFTMDDVEHYFADEFSKQEFDGFDLEKTDDGYKFGYEDGNSDMSPAYIEGTTDENKNLQSLIVYYWPIDTEDFKSSESLLDAVQDTLNDFGNTPVWTINGVSCFVKMVVFAETLEERNGNKNGMSDMFSEYAEKFVKEEQTELYGWKIWNEIEPDEDNNNDRGSVRLCLQLNDAEMPEAPETEHD